jgi:hypothetical protein
MSVEQGANTCIEDMLGQCCLEASYLVADNSTSASNLSAARKAVLLRATREGRPLKVMMPEGAPHTSTLLNPMVPAKKRPINAEILQSTAAALEQGARMGLPIKKGVSEFLLADIHLSALPDMPTCSSPTCSPPGSPSTSAGETSVSWAGETPMSTRMGSLSDFETPTSSCRRRADVPSPQHGLLPESR